MDIAYKLSLILPIPIKRVIKPILYPMISWKQKKDMKIKAKRVFSQFIGYGDLVFDIGAYVGDLTEIFLELGARVICVEPNPYCIEILKKRYAKNNNVIVVSKGVGSFKGRAVLHINELSPGTSTFWSKWCKQDRFKGQSFNKRVFVSVTTLDSLIKKFGVPRFCKIDVEGFEEMVLNGLSIAIPFLSFEFTNSFPEKIKFCLNRLLSLREESVFKYSLKEDYELRPSKWINFAELLCKLETYGEEAWGDIYVKLTNDEK